MWIALCVLVAPLGWYFWEKMQRKTHPMPGGFRADLTIDHTEEWELYHNDFSLCSKKARVCMAELGIPYVSHHIDLIETGSYENLSARYLRANPAGILPLLVHNGHPIFESHEQILYAANYVKGTNPLIPAGGDERTVMDHWVHKSSLLGDDPISGMRETAGNAVPGLTLPIFATMINAIPWRQILVGLLFHRAKVRPLMFMRMKSLGSDKLAQEPRMVGVIRKSREAMHVHLDELETALESSDGEFIVGSQFTLADVGMSVILERLAEVDWLDEFLTNRLHVAAYWETVQARPSYQKGIANHRHPAVVAGFAKVLKLKSENEKFREALMGSIA
ncbi:MAG: hypothetical protein GKR90_12355 [Pseudomonadales bacterium]|nr:hypothetical protein [Pseudomonadales bacterium]